MSIRELWRQTYWLPRLALACAAVAAVLNVASYAGLSMRSPYESLAVVHLLVMGLGFVFSIRLGYHHWLSLRVGPVRRVSAGTPWALFWGLAGSLVYLIVVFVAHLAAYGEGGPDVQDAVEVWVVRGEVMRTLPPGSVATYAARELRLFSAAWLFFGLLIAVAGHYVEARIRALQGWARQVAT